MKVLIVDSNDPALCPYHAYYQEAFARMGMTTQVVGWDRDGTISETKSSMAFIYRKPSSESAGSISKLIAYCGFASAVEEFVERGEYDLLIVCGIQNAFYLRKLLYNQFRGRFLLDIRDYSPMFPFVKPKLRRTIRESVMTVISSYGYLRWLPNQEYVICHNTSNSLIESTRKTIVSSDAVVPYKVLTIGSIREYASHARVIDELGHLPDFELTFAGDGSARERLENYCKASGCVIAFTGRYRKEDELSIVSKYDIVNILLDPRDIGKTTLLANRLYSAMLCRKPVMANPESIHAELVDQYKIGVVVSSEESIEGKLRNYFNSYDKDEYLAGNEAFLRRVYNENCIFQSKLDDLVTRLDSGGRGAPC